MKANGFTVWLLGALLTINLVLIGMLWSTVVARMDRIEAQIQVISAQVLTVQIQNSRLDDMFRRLGEIEVKLRQ